VLPVLVTGIGAGLVGAYLGTVLTRAEPGEAARARRERRGLATTPSIAPAAVGLVAIAAIVALNVGDSRVAGVSGQVSLAEVAPEPRREVEATIRIDPPAALEDARWVSATAWQGGEKLVLDHLEQVGPGVYRTTEPLPVYGTWKAMIRVHDGDALLALPIYLPEDRAIPAEGVPASPGGFTRPFVDETEVLQRELKDGVPGYLSALAYLSVGAIVVALIALLGWVLVRLGRDDGSAGPGPRPKPARTLEQPLPGLEQVARSR
jgi:hypothetical protein